MENEMVWRSGKPEKNGAYVVAILYEDGLGVISVDRYSLNRGWSSDDNVIAYIPFREVITAAKVEWPEHLTPQ
ncbi:hypothetical protein ONV78_16330 [Hahella sp. CR1]|uniref:hypothetical protein n=1 Tax=Hahella sp. CR1 TaxID=2992807 RepID=UPI002442FF82|nr:hypothetical protein [Hahella sp. CR1]MDG9669308.1 hypothetical protein [Hahella sp. CR1]